MKKIIQVEAIAPFIMVIPLINKLNLNFEWWVWIPIFLLPDVSMLGYAFGNKIGSYSYNLLHHQTIAVIVAVMGFIIQLPLLELSGLVLLGHSSIDRFMGYGLKLEKGFKYTHLGPVGKVK